MSGPFDEPVDDFDIPEFDEPRDTVAEPRFRLHRMGQLEVRPIQWLVRGLIERDTLAMVFADPGAGKSFFAIDVAACVASGSDFHRHRSEQGVVAYLAGEGMNGIARRRLAWEIRRQVSLADAPLFVSMGPAALCHPGSAAEVCDALDAITAEHGAPVLVVVDTLARNFGPGDENSTQDMSGFIATADLIRTRYRATVLLVHHTGHADKSRARGAMALHGALDASYRLDKDEAGVVRLEAVKMKDAAEPEPMAFRIRSVDLGITDDDGEPVTSAILDCTSYEPPPVQGKAGRGKWQTVALEALRNLHRERRETLAASGFDTSTARVSVHDWRNACLDAAMPKQRFYDIRDTLAERALVNISNGFVTESSPVSGSVRFPIGKPDRTGLPNPDEPDTNRTANRTETGLEESP